MRAVQQHGIEGTIKYVSAYGCEPCNLAFQGLEATHKRDYLTGGHLTCPECESHGIFELDAEYLKEVWQEYKQDTT